MFIDNIQTIFVESGVIYMHLLNLLVLAILILLFFTARRTSKSWTKINDYLGVVTKTINSVRYGDLTKKIENFDLPNSEPLAESLNRMIETLYDREKMIDEYQEELHRQNKFLEAVIDSLSDGLIVFDENLRILRATQKISEWFDIDGKKLVGGFLSDYLKYPVNKNIFSLKEEDVYILNDKSSTFVASCMDLKLEDKKKRYIMIIKNVTDQRELETMKEDFVATLTHDLKVPIIAETNMLELFLNESFGKISEKQEVALKNMQISNRELLDLVQIVLDTYKLRDKNIQLHKENVMLKEFLEEISYEMQPIADKLANHIKLDIPRNIRVYADRMQLKRVIKNLIQNAISYGETNSPIEITIGEIPKYIIIKVKDYGKGIAPEDINKIFVKYYSAAKKFRKIGTGLGLYLSLQIMKAHNGDLTVESVKDKYTEFCVKLPAASDSNLYYGE